MADLRLTARLGLDKTGFDAGMTKATNQVMSFGAGLAAQLAGAFSVAAMAQYLNGLTDTVTRIKDLSEQYGVTAGEVQKADFALKQSGLRFEDLSSALTALGRHRRDAAEGNEELLKTFDRFGITLENLNDPALRTFDILQKIAAAQKEGNLTAQEQVALMDLLGPRAAKLVNILSDLGTTKIDVISDDAIQRIDAAVKYLERFKQKLDQIAATKLAQVLQLASFLPGLGGRERLAEEFAEAIAGGLRPAGNAAEAGLANMAGHKPKEPGNLWDIAAAKTTTAKPAGIQSDQFGRIGAFTGSAAQSAQVQVMRRQLTVLELMRQDFISRGILIRGTD